MKSDTLDSSVNTHGLLSTSMKEAAKGGLTQFTKMNSKILEVVSQNNVLLLEKVRDMEEGCQKQLKEKDEQIKRLQNLLGNKDDQMKKITSRIEAGSEFDQKAKKFFGENEDFHKKRAQLGSSTTRSVTFIGCLADLCVSPQFPGGQDDPPNG